MKIVFKILLLSLVIGYSLRAQNLVLLVDKSGSLKTNDPQDLRKDAIKFLIDQNKKYSGMAIYSFGSGVISHHPNQQTIFYDTKNDRSRLLSVANTLQRDDLLTDLKQCLSKVYDDLTKINIWDNSRVLIFTDAQLREGDIPSGYTIDNYLLSLYDMAKKFANKNTPIDAIAFTRHADLTYLQELASITGGYAIHANSPEVANQTVAKIISDYLKGPFGPNKVIDINVSSLVSSFQIHAFNNKADINIPTIILRTPNGDIEHDYIQTRYRTSISVEKINPVEGIWRALVRGADDAKVYYGKKLDIDLFVNKPKGKDLSLCNNSIIPFDVEVKSKDETKLIGLQCEALIKDLSGNNIQSIKLQKNGLKFSGNLKVEASQGKYELFLRLIKDEDFIEKKFSVNVGDCIGLDYKINHDIVLENPLLISVVKPKESKTEINLNLKTPQGEISKIDLYDNGLEENGDNIANDGIFAARINCLESAGKYELELSLSYEKDGIPVMSKNIEEVYKIISLSSKTLEVSYSEDSTWSNAADLIIKNLTSYKILLKDFLIDSRYIERVRIDFPGRDNIILPREEKTFKVSFLETNNLIGENTLFNTLYCDLVDEQRNENSFLNAKINLHFRLYPASPFAAKILCIFLVVSLIILILVMVGLILIVPLRFKNVIYYGGSDEVGINDYRKFLYPYAELDDGARLGISLLGFGHWYFRDSENSITKYFNNIKLRKEKF